MAGRKYGNPPIDEATCQFTMAEPIPWDPATPGRLFERLKDRYPGMPSQQQLLQANLAPAPGAVTPNLAFVQNERIVFVNSDGTDRLSVGPEIVSLHRTRPYVGFEEELLPRIRQDLPAVFETLEHDQSFIAASVRYVNKIVIDQQNFDLSSYFTYWGSSDPLPEAFGGNVTGFFNRIAANRLPNPEALTLTFASVDAPKESAAFVLDVDLSRRFDGPLGTEEAIQKLVDLKTLENLIFESLITDECRELFE